MTAIKQRGSELPDNLPVLTQAIGDELLDDLPTLTEVVTDIRSAEEAQPAAPQDITADHEIPEEGDLPVLTESIRTASPSPIETATEETLPPAALSEEDMQLLLQRIEAHLEAVFTQKLKVHLEQLKRQAIEQAVSELKAELPELLRGALNAHPEL